MSNAIESKACALEKLLVALLEERSQLEFSASILPGRVVFRVGAPAAVMGRLVGYNGQHLRSLQLIAQLIGQTMEQEWVLKLEDPTDTRRHGRLPAPDPDDCAPQEDGDMLSEVLEACGVRLSCPIHIQGGIAGGFDFTVCPERQEDNAALCDPNVAIYTDAQRERAPLNLITALRTILKAVGKSQGVEYRLSIQ